jgi:hypothetical protein
VTAPRSCRRCGAVLNPDIRWCTRCYAPVTEFAPREPQLPPRTDLVPIDQDAVRRHHTSIRLEQPVYSRVRGGPTTLGLWGRVGLTALIVSFLPRGHFSLATVLYLVSYIPVAGLALSGIWRKEAIGPASEHAIAQHDRTVDRIRVWAAVAGIALVAVALVDRAMILGYLPAAPFFATALFRGWAEAVDEGITEARSRPVGTLVLLNGLNLLDAILSDAAIGAGTARELNPFVMAIGGPAKLASVAALSGLLFWKRPSALVYPALVFVALISYHLMGLLGGFALGS